MAEDYSDDISKLLFDLDNQLKQTKKDIEPFNISEQLFDLYSQLEETKRDIETSKKKSSEFEGFIEAFGSDGESLSEKWEKEETEEKEYQEQVARERALQQALLEEKRKSEEARINKERQRQLKAKKNAASEVKSLKEKWEREDAELKLEQQKRIEEAEHQLQMLREEQKLEAEKQADAFGSFVSILTGEAEQVKEEIQGIYEELDEPMPTFASENNVVSEMSVAENLISDSVMAINKIKEDDIQEEISSDLNILKLSKRLDQLQKNLGELNAIGWGQRGMTYGSGEVKLEFLDDVDATTAKVDGKSLVYQASSDKWVGSESGATGGYEFTGGFLNRSNAVTYTQAQADAGTWMRFGFSSSKQSTTDSPYWGNGPDPDEAPHSGTTDYQGVGTFSGAYMPTGVTSMFNYTDDTAYNQALTMSVTTAGVTENLPVTSAIGSYNFKQYKVGDFANIRVDFNVTPHISNTTLECALIWSTRDADDNITFTFPLTITPFFFGDNTAGKQFLTRPMFTAYFASQEDINARALFAIKSDNTITVEPFTTLTTVVAR